MLTRYSALLAVVTVFAAPAAGRAADPFAETVDKANRKLVKIFGAGGFQRLNNYGTGIVISSEGHILTVASQLLDTSDLVVHMHDGQRLRAQVVATEPLLDAALIKIKVEGKKIDEPNGLNLGEKEYFNFEEAVKRGPAAPGDWVLALSNTFEIALREESLSAQRGVISAYTKMAGRRGIFEFPYTGEVYVVDAITNNPGAAGGALLTRKGELIGIIGREIKNTLTETWMNYAIPITGKVEFRDRVTVKDKDGKDVEEEKTVAVTIPDFVRAAMKGEYKTRKRPDIAAGQGGYHGIVFVPNVLERTPAFVEDVVPGSPADKAGLRPDDLVSFIDGEPVVSIKAFGDFMRKNTRAGTVVRLEVRRGEALQTIEMTLGQHPAKPKPPTTPAPPPVGKK
ncbi:S1C family serine protease [Gemmata sp. JC717]|uniref:S1C family serine protease n=1 Tax=Gemmata algarum TaxID=2975278 RepID=UPI0021BB3DEE|nr:S1C family serine protease [Gemmata algarum]MDY3552106.1 S1C family serine protease [Gemmata algarum]